jgi:hypothetical protein
MHPTLIEGEYVPRSHARNAGAIVGIYAMVFFAIWFCGIFYFVVETIRYVVR